MDMGVLKKWFEWSQAVTSMMLVQLIATGMQLLSRIILNQGTFVFALMAYRHVVAAICVAPFAFFLERGNAKKLSWLVCFWLFLNALTGIIMAMGLFYYALASTTATYATNFLNLIPIVTFAFAIIIGVEKLGLGTRAGKMKFQGALLCVAGALTTSLYKGKSFHIVHHKLHTHMAIKHTHPHWTRGTLMLVGSIFSYATWFIVQVKLLKAFPLKICATLYTCIMAALQSTVIGLCLDRSKAAWRLGWNLQLVTIFYSVKFPNPNHIYYVEIMCIIMCIMPRKLSLIFAENYGICCTDIRALRPCLKRSMLKHLITIWLLIFEFWRFCKEIEVCFLVQGILNSAVTYWLISWAIANRGPTYPSVFNPLSLIFVAVAEGLLLGEAITTGCLLGAVFIMVGLYSFLWGKKEELKSLPQPKVHDPVEVQQSTAVVIPSSSIVNSTIDVEGEKSLNRTSHNLP